jgi:hypothetical protein
MGLSRSHRNKIQNTKHMKMFNEMNCFWDNKKKNTNIKHLQVLVSSKLIKEIKNPWNFKFQTQMGKFTENSNSRNFHLLMAS